MQRPQKRVSLPKLSDRYELGNSGLRVSPICLGMTQTETVRAAFDLGINFFFISNDLHWSLYAPLMAGLENLLASGVKRDDIVVAGVSYMNQPMFRHLPFNELLAAVPRLERIDLLIAGAIYSDDFLQRQRSLEDARRNGRWGCKAIGGSFHDRSAARMAVCAELIDIAYVRYNPAHPGAEQDLFPALRPDRRCLTYNFKSNYAYVPEPVFRKLALGADYKLPKLTDSYRFALSRPELDGILASPQTPAEVAELSRALERGPIPASKAQFMKDIWQLATGRASLDREPKPKPEPEPKPE